MFARHQTKTAHIIDSFPLPVTHFKCACNSKNFKGEAGFGYCASKGEKYYGFKCHILTTLDGEIAGFQITQANESESNVAVQLTENKAGQLFADKGYLADKIKEQLAAQRIDLITPVRHNMKDPIAKC